MYTNQQIQAVRELQQLHGVPGVLSDEACIQYLDWHNSNKHDAGSIKEACVHGIANGLAVHERQFRKLSELAHES